MSTFPHLDTILSALTVRCQDCPVTADPFEFLIQCIHDLRQSLPLASFPLSLAVPIASTNRLDHKTSVQMNGEEMGTENAENGKRDGNTHVRSGTCAVRYASMPQLVEEPYLDLECVQHFFGTDIGGSLCKVTFFEQSGNEAIGKEKNFFLNSITYGMTGMRDPLLSFSYQSGVFHFINFETRRMSAAIELMKEHDLLQYRRRASSVYSASAVDSVTPDLPLESKRRSIIMATGGGAYKYAQMVFDKLQLVLKKKDELNCLLAGLNFLLHAVQDECYYISDPSKPDVITWDLTSVGKPIYPYLLVNIGSGVSFLRIDSASRFERVSGTSLGGGTYLGLCRLLTKCKSFKDLIDLSAHGNSETVNMLVRDIYGGDYQKFGLKASTVASSFGKIVMKDDPWDGITEPDVARTLLDMISQNISQLAYQCAVQHKVTRIMFAGNFLRQNRISMASISFAIDYWSGGKMKALFLKHEGYCGSIGAFLLQHDVASDE